MKLKFPVIVDSVKTYKDKNGVEKTVIEIREPYEDSSGFKGYRHKPSCIMTGTHWDFTPGCAYMANGETYVFDGKETLRVTEVLPGEVEIE